MLHPLCLEDPLIFKQEGWHYALDSEDGEMAFVGVVMSEMEGIYSQPDQIHWLATQVREPASRTGHLLSRASHCSVRSTCQLGRGDRCCASCVH